MHYSGLFMKNNQISQEVHIFRGRVIPELRGLLVGYSALINAYELDVPLPDILSIISFKHKKYGTEEWAVYTPRYKPEDSLAGHILFALKHEAVDLAVLSALFRKITPEIITEII